MRECVKVTVAGVGGGKGKEATVKMLLVISNLY